MFLYISNSKDPAFNIATEEYLLKHYDADFAFLYINDPSLIVGKHQNTIAEINVPFVVENNIPVVRRLSGGGTVYHDEGNLNYCFIVRGKEGYLVDFKKYTLPVLSLLQSLDVNAYLRGKSDLVIDDLKFSGNAEHVYRNKILHHGTMLFDSKLNFLDNAIKSDWNKFSDRAVRSNRSVVTNIKTHLTTPMDIINFRNLFIEELRQDMVVDHFELSAKDVDGIQELIVEKYSQWHWNFGYSPKYSFNQSIVYQGQEISASIQVKKGIIEELTLAIDGVAMVHLNDSLIGQTHDYHVLKNIIEEMGSNKLPVDQLLKVLF